MLLPSSFVRSYDIANCCTLGTTGSIDRSDFQTCQPPPTTITPSLISFPATTANGDRLSSQFDRRSTNSGGNANLPAADGSSQFSCEGFASGPQSVTGTEELKEGTSSSNNSTSNNETSTTDNLESQRTTHQTGHPSRKPLRWVKRALDNVKAAPGHVLDRIGKHASDAAWRQEGL